MKLRIAEKILKRYLQTKLFDEVNSKYPYTKMRANERDYKALHICRKFKGDEYWPFRKWRSGPGVPTIIMILVSIISECTMAPRLNIKYLG